jgi:DNA-binding YbaB/EbfC family protein
LKIEEVEREHVMAKSMKGLMKQAQKMQKEMMKVQEELSSQEFEGSAGGDMVKVKMNGQMEISGISIKPEAVDPEDVEMLEDLIMAAITNAREKASEASNTRLSGLTGGMKIPGMM